MCRVHRPRPPVGPYGLSGQPPVSDQGHRAVRTESRARTRPGHDGAATSLDVGRPRRVESARTRTTTTSGRRRRTARGLAETPAPALRPEPIEPAELPALDSGGAGRTARAALASLAAHAQRPPQGRARP